MFLYFTYNDLLDNSSVRRVFYTEPLDRILTTCHLYVQLFTPLGFLHLE